MWVFYLPSWILVEVIYLVRHPKTFRWRAVAIGLPVATLSYVFLLTGARPPVVYCTQVAAVALYYFVKFREHRKARIDRITKQITS